MFPSRSRQIEFDERLVLAGNTRCVWSQEGGFQKIDEWVLETDGTNLMEVLARGPEFAPDAVVHIVVAMEVLLQTQGSPAEQLKLLTALLDTGSDRLPPETLAFIASSCSARKAQRSSRTQRI